MPMPIETMEQVKLGISGLSVPPDELAAARR